ncbi:MAG TPA: stage II sporulation protein M [Candidatus Tumulicola sp.]|jgi:uncharacterized membrane protein SpoIIM required for sporulation
MRSQTQFRVAREASWLRLDALIAQAGRRGVRSLRGGTAVEAGRLYRSAAADLAYARGREFDSALVEYLNRLTARAHAVIYGAAVESGGGRIGAFFGRTFPREFRRSFGTIAICIAITMATAVGSYAVVRAHPERAVALLPRELVPDRIQKSLHDSNFGFDRSYSPAVSAEIITNNVKVAAIAFAGCVTLGILTVYIIAFNGLMLGGLAGLFTNAGYGTDYWATIAPHGVIELTAIQIAGAAGLLIAAGVLYPGRLSRKDAIRANARRAATLIAGVATMLIVAGTIEGFLSPQRWPANVRIGIGACTAIALILYFGFAGRNATADPVASRANIDRLTLP